MKIDEIFSKKYKFMIISCIQTAIFYVSVIMNVFILIAAEIFALDTGIRKKTNLLVIV